MKSITKPQKCKGIFKNIIKEDITIDDYRDTLFSSTEKRRKKKKKNTMKSIKSYKHIIKWSLSCFDNKIYILEDEITTLAYGCFHSIIHSF